MLRFFVFGREPALSLAEILAVLDREKTTFNQASAKISREAAVFEIGENTDFDAFSGSLGGALKSGSVLKTLTGGLEEQGLARKLADELAKKPISGKISFGISVYSLEPQNRISRLNALRKTAKKLGLAVKRELKALDRSARYVTSKEPTLSAVVITQNKLLELGAEFILLALGEKIFLGKTEFVHGWREASRLDYGRPERDPASGMLPPRLARILVNLARAPRSAALADPFCGSGTIVTEALRLGYRNITASDIDSTAIARTKSNVLWITKDQKIARAAESVRYIDAGIKKLPSILGNDVFDVIITEPYLGPALRGRQKLQDIERIARELMPLYDDMLRAFGALLKRRGKAVVTFPMWRIGKETVRSPALAAHREYGFALREPVSVELIAPDIAEEFGMNGKTLIYGRPDQKVWREVAILERIN